MSEAVETFLKFWGQFEAHGRRYLHPADGNFSNLDDLELSLLPIPFVGNLCEAEAVILMLNPGLNADDVAWEQETTFRAAVEHNLLQYFPENAFPFFYLDPQFSRHPGAGYWAESRKIRGTRDQQKLRSVIHALAQRDGVCVAAARAHVARKVAVVQLVPYHSAQLKHRSVFGNLPSVCQARAFVHGLVREQSKLVIAARSVHEWGFADPQNNERPVVYQAAQGASASLTMNSEGGRALFARLSPVMA
ncbi:MAG: hypothetical protein ACOY5H_04970 [Pseudomonadota bacterium]